MHLKRQEIPKNWPVYRKGTKYIVRPHSDLKAGVPILVVLRDMMKVAQNKKEVKSAIHMKNILLNNKAMTDEKVSVMLFDTITLVPSRKSYRLSLTGTGKFEVGEIKENEANSKIAKVTDKKILKGKKVQINLGDGNNFISDMKCNTSDSVVINFKEKKIEKCIPLEGNAKVFIFAGKHAGKTGKIKNMEEKSNMALVDSEGKEISVLTKQIMAVN